jgi:hypothetical protein
MISIWRGLIITAVNNPILQQGIAVAVGPRR